MKTTTIRFGTRTFVIVSLLALPAGSAGCGAAPGAPDDGVDPSTSSAAPGEKPALAADTDATAPDQPTGELPDPPSTAPGDPAPYRGGPRQK